VTASLLAWLLAATAAAVPAGDGAKRAACTKAVDRSIGIVAALAAGVAQNLADGLSTGETEATKCLRANPGNVKKCLKLDDKAARAKIAEAIDQCMQWPDALVACLSDFEKMETPACVREWEKFAGLVSSEPLADGPSPRWQMRLPDSVNDAVDVGGGRVVIAGKKQVFAVRGQKVVWSKPFETMRLVSIPESGCVLIFYEERFACLDVESGREKWKGVHPIVDKDSREDSWLMGAAHAGGQTVLADYTGRLFLADPRACARKSSGCLVPSGKVSEGLYTPPELWILPSGARVVLGVSRLFLTDRFGKEYAAMSFSTGGPLAVEAGGTALFAYKRTVDEKKCTYQECAREEVLVRMDPGKCKNRIKNREKSLGEPIENCGAVIVGKADDKDDDFETPPIGLPDGDLIVDTDKLQRWGKAHWKTDVGMMGLPLLVGDRLYVSTRAGAGGKLELRAIDVPTGRTLERSWIPGGGGRSGQGFLLLVDGLLYLFADGQIYAYPIKAKG